MRDWHPPRSSEVCHPKYDQHLPHFRKWNFRPDGKLLPTNARLARRLRRPDFSTSLLKDAYDPLRQVCWCENVKKVLYARLLAYFYDIFFIFCTAERHCYRLKIKIQIVLGLMIVFINRFCWKKVLLQDDAAARAFVLILRRSN